MTTYLSREDILTRLAKNITLESGYLLTVLGNSEIQFAYKESLWEKVNKIYSEKHPEKGKLIGSRHILDYHIARLEGAGIIQTTTSIGKTKIYEVTELGFAVIEHRQNLADK